MSRPSCRFFNTPTGCNRGNQCKFAHSPLNDTARLSQSTPPSDHRAAVPRNSTSPGGNGNSPPGVCSFFWENGRCRREFSCRYKHIQKANESTLGPPSTSATTTRSATVLQRVAPFLTEQGLSKMSGSGTDGFFSQDLSSSLSPTEAHNALKHFLYDNYRFQNAFHIYAFLKPLNSATASNAGWV